MRSTPCHPLHLVSWVGGIVALAGLMASPGRAGDPEQINPIDTGSQAFQYILQARGLKPVAGFEQLAEAPSQTLLIVLGDTEVLQQVPDGVRIFLDRGGAVLVATDQPSQAQTRESLRVAVTGQPVRDPQAQRAYRGSADCPVLIDFQPDNPLFRDVKSIATNRPSYLLVSEDSAVLASFPPRCHSGGQRLESSAFAVGGNRLDGRFLVLADHSIFIDGMMLQRDNDNFTFAYNCVDWLGARPQGPRDRVLLVVDGQILTDFGAPLPFTPPSRLPTLDLNKALLTLEQRNAFDRLLLHLIPKERLFQFGFLALTMLLLAYGLVRLVCARHRPEETVPLFAVSLAQSVPAKTVVEQRHDSVVASGNLWEAARAVAQQFFDPTGRIGTPKGRRPTLQVRGSLWERRGLTRQIRRLWELACETSPSSISRREFDRLLDQIATLQAARADGTLTLGEPQ